MPAGGVGLTLEDVAEIHDNLREPVNSSERAKRPGTYPYYGVTGQVGWIDDFRQDGEYVLLGEDGAPFFEPTKEKAYLVSGKCWVNNHAHVLKGREGLCSNRYLLYALNQANYRGYANGTTRLKLTQSAMRQLPINLAPFAEQHRIVAKIEELFSELDKGIENLKTARAQLKVYRQALLKNAFEGKLTVQWHLSADRQALAGRETADAQPASGQALLKRIQQERLQRYQQQLVEWEQSKSPSIPLLQRGKTTSAAATTSHPPLKKGGRGDLKPKAPKPLPPLTAEELAELPELPEGWGWFKLASLSDVSGGLTKNQKRNTLPIRRPFLRVGNVYANRLELSDMHDTGISETETERVTLVKGDILVVEGNGSVDQIGRVAVWNGAIEGCVHQNHLIKARPLNVVCSEFILHFLMSELGRKFIVRSASSTSGLHTLSISKVESLYVPFCVREEQEILLSELSSKLSLADQLDLTLSTSLQQAEALRQSILKKAFAGQLVPQDPHDLPAPQPGKWFVYVLECDEGSLYKGHSQDVVERWKQHATRRGAEWTSTHSPRRLVHWEEFDSQEAAVSREKELKTGYGREWLVREIKAGRTRQAGEPASVLLARIKAERTTVVKNATVAAKLRKKKSGREIP